MSIPIPPETVCVVAPGSPEVAESITLNELVSHEIGARGWHLVLPGASPQSTVLAESAHKRGGRVSLVLPHWEADRIDPSLPGVEIQLSESVEGQFRRIALIADRYLVIAETPRDLGHLERITGHADRTRPITVLSRYGHWSTRPGTGDRPQDPAEVTWDEHQVLFTSDTSAAVSLVFGAGTAVPTALATGGVLCS